jgi:hypothetical protein
MVRTRPSTVGKRTVTTWWVDSCRRKVSQQIPLLEPLQHIETALDSLRILAGDELKARDSYELAKLEETLKKTAVLFHTPVSETRPCPVGTFNLKTKWKFRR